MRSLWPNTRLGSTSLVNPLTKYVRFASKLALMVVVVYVSTTTTDEAGLDQRGAGAVAAAEERRGRITGERSVVHITPRPKGPPPIPSNHYNHQWLPLARHLLLRLHSVCSPAPTATVPWPGGGVLKIRKTGLEKKPSSSIYELTVSAATSTTWWQEERQRSTNTRIRRMTEYMAAAEEVGGYPPMCCGQILWRCVKLSSAGLMRRRMVVGDSGEPLCTLAFTTGFDGDVKVEGNV